MSENVEKSRRMWNFHTYMRTESIENTTKSKESKGWVESGRYRLPGLDRQSRVSQEEYSSCRLLSGLQPQADLKQRRCTHVRTHNPSLCYYPKNWGGAGCYGITKVATGQNSFGSPATSVISADNFIDRGVRSLRVLATHIRFPRNSVSNNNEN